MIKIANVEVAGWEHAIRGMRNPKNSWDKSDSHFNVLCDDVPCDSCPAYRRDHNGFGCVDYLNNELGSTDIGPNDHKLMMSLAAGGPVHAKYRRMITVYLDITAPLYWWKEFDTYKVGTVANSCSTMHKIHEKEFTVEDFSCEHLFDKEDLLDNDKQAWISEDNALTAINVDGDLCYYTPKGFIRMACNILNRYRKLFIETKDKKYWWQMIQLLPSSYNQKRTIMLNYEVLAGMYESRKAHKLDEWKEFCNWIESLPYSELITGKE